MSASFEAWQQSSQGISDRSHPELIRLDALAQTTTYPGWEEDFKKAEEGHFSSNALGPGFDRCLHILIEKQHMHMGDRSHPRLVQLDALSLTYPGWEGDVKEAEEEHFKNFKASFTQCLKSMQNKQAAFVGDRSHPELVKLDALAQTTTYPGWEEDLKKAEEQHFSSNAIGPGFDRCLHILIEKQHMHIGDRSHPRLVQLDALSLTYPGWEGDVKEAEEEHFKNFKASFTQCLKSMQNKQRAFQLSCTTVFQKLPENTMPPPPPPLAHKRNVASDKCVICLEKPRSHVFVPCGHYATCGTCATVSLQRDGNRCPMCRQPVEKAIKIYFS